MSYSLSNLIPPGRKSLAELTDYKDDLDQIVHLFLNPELPIRTVPVCGWRRLIQLAGTGYDGEWQFFAIDKNGLTFRSYVDGCSLLPCLNGKVLELMDRMGYMLPAMQQKQARNYRKYVSSNK